LKVAKASLPPRNIAGLKGEDTPSLRARGHWAKDPTHFFLCQCVGGGNNQVILVEHRLQLLRRLKSSLFPE
jgi:hypothetical protein